MNRLIGFAIGVLFAIAVDTRSFKEGWKEGEG